MRDGPYDPNGMLMPFEERSSFADQEEPSGTGPSTMDRAPARTERVDVFFHETEESRLAASLSRIEHTLQKVLHMNGRELAVLARIDKATTQIGGNVQAVADELRTLQTGGDDTELDDKLEAAATKLEEQANALTLVATPKDPNPAVAELVVTPPTEP